MVRRLFVLVAVLALAIPSAAFAQNPSPADRFEQMPTGQIDPAVLPNALDDARTVIVMLEMEGDPVAVVQSEQPDGELTGAERNQIKNELKARQDAIKGQIAARGGRVLSQLQFAYNGMKVQVARRDVAALAALPNVTAVRGIQVVERDNATSVPFLGIPTEVWDPEDGLGFTGAGIKIAVIDTGIDYTHANFGGPGTVEAYELANANDTTIGDAGDAGLFGPDAPKVKGGIDLAGDAYDGGADEGSPALIPHPDPDPLDCVFTDGSVGHGSHVAGTATGFGVLSDGTTYTGPYDSTTHANDFEIGPGVAPEADLYFVRVFGCDGSTQLTVDAIEWAVANDMDVINMSLGSSFGRGDDPSAVAATNAAAAGVTVVTSAGNSGPNPYITGSPGTGTGAIATAAVDSNEQFPGVVLDLEPGASIEAISANGIVPPDGTSYEVVVLTDDPTTPGENEALGCSVAAYEKAGIVEGGGQLAVTERGVCARVARGVFGEQAGAAAVAMINNAASYPPFEGPILSNPDTGELFQVTIPFLGVFGPATSADANALRAADTATSTATTIVNPGYTGFASFSSGGPRTGDSTLKPDIAAPGVSIISTASGTGNKGYVLSGTSMASPHVAGIAALVRQAHPDWTTEEVKAAIVNSGDPGGVAGYRTTRAGSGLVNAAAAIGNDVVALGSKVKPDGSVDLEGFHNANLSFGFAELGKDFKDTQAITIRNHGSTTVTLALGWNASPFSAPANVSFNKASVTVKPGKEAKVQVTLRVAASAIPSSNQADQHAFHEVSGNVTLTGGGMTLRVPYLLVPRSLSDIGAKAQGLDGDNTSANVTVTNKKGAITGSADFYTWGLEDRNDVNENAMGGGGYDVRAVGVQSFPFGATQLLVFAINNHDRWSNAAVNEWDININNDADPEPEFTVFAFDSGAIRAGSFNGLLEVFFVNNATGGLFASGFLASSPTDSSTLLLPIPANALGLTPADGSFSYDAVSFSLEGPGFDVVDGVASYNPFDKALEDGQFEEVARGAAVTVPVAIDPVAFDQQDPLGLMVVGIDDKSGKDEADLLKARR